MLNKIAQQFEIPNYDELLLFQRNEQGIFIKTDDDVNKFIERFKTMQQISSRAPSSRLEAGIKMFISSELQDSAKAIINSIGEAEFRKAENWSRIEDTIRSYRTKVHDEDRPSLATPGLTNPITPGEISRDKAERQIEEIKQKIETSEETPSITSILSNEYEGLKADQIDEIEKAKKRKYSNDLTIPSEVLGIISTIIENYRRVNDGRTVRLSQQIIAHNFKKLHDWADKFEPKPEPAREPVEPSPSEAMGEKDKFDLVMKKMKGLKGKRRDEFFPEEDEAKPEIEPPKSKKQKTKGKKLKEEIELTSEEREILTPSSKVNFHFADKTIFLTSEQISEVYNFLVQDYPDFRHSEVIEIFDVLIRSYIVLNKAEVKKGELAINQQAVKQAKKSLEDLAKFDPYITPDEQAEVKTTTLLRQISSGLSGDDAFKLLQLDKDKVVFKIQDLDDKIELITSQVASEVTKESAKDIDKMITELTPDIDLAQINSDYQKIRELFLEWSKEVSQVMGSEGGPSAELKRKINDLAFSAKNYDYNIYRKFQESILKIDQKISELYSQRVEISQDLIKLNKNNIAIENLENLKDTLNSRYINIIKPQLLSKRFEQDAKLTEAIALPLLYICNYSAYLNYKDPGYKFFNQPNSKGKTTKPTYIFPPIYNESSSIQEDFKAEFQKQNEKIIISKYLKFWEEGRVGFNSDESRDLVRFMQISRGNIIQAAMTQVQRAAGGKNIPITTCPSCHRIIDLKGKPEDFGLAKDKDKDKNKENPLLQIPLFAPYKEQRADNFKDLILSEEYMRYQGGKEVVKYKPPGKYEELTTVRKMLQETKAGDLASLLTRDNMSWDEINDLVNSSEPQRQIIGMHRRGEALRSVGAKFLGIKKLDVIKSFCPMGQNKIDGDTNTCGISFSEPIGDRSYNLQPKWNGEVPVVEAGARTNATRRIYTNSAFSPKGWKDTSLQNLAENRGKGGFRYSKTYFGCPCHIEDAISEISRNYMQGGLKRIDPTTLKRIDQVKVEDSKYYLTHNRLAIALSKDGDYHPPTDRLGNLKNIAPETMTYLICGSNAALSSMDRDPKSQTYILNYFKKLSQEQPNEFLELINFLISNGVDDLEIMQMLEDLGKEEIISNSSVADRKNRFLKIEEIFTKIAASLPKNILDIIKDLTLVCPLGHRFTIRQSLDFGRSHTAIRINTEKEAIKNLQSSLLDGKFNFDNFLNYLEPLSNKPKGRTYLYYDEWITKDIDKRRINFKRTGTLAEYFLKYNFNGFDYAFKDDIDVMTDLIWKANSSRGHDNEHRIDLSSAARFYSADGGKKDDDDGDKKPTEKKDEKTLAQAEGSNYNPDVVNRWERMIDRLFDPDTPSPPIPGGISIHNLKQFDSPNFQEVSQNMNALGMALKSALGIINNWMESVFDPEFSKSLTRRMADEELLFNFSNIIVDKYFKNRVVITIDGLEMYEDEAKAEEKGKIFENKIREEIKEIFSESLKDNTRSINVARKPGSSPRQSAKMIIMDTLSDFVEEIDNLSKRVLEEERAEGLSFDIEILKFTPSDVKGMIEEILEDKDLGLSVRSVWGDKFIKLEDRLVISVTDEEQQIERNVGRLTLVAYSKYLANAIYKMNNLFFNKNSQLYVGYNPLSDINISDADDILKISKNDIETINTNWTRKQIITNEYTRYKIDDDFSKKGVEYISLIDKAYDFLKSYTDNAQSLSINSLSIQEAKNYISNFMKNSAIEQYQNIYPDKKPEEIADEINKLIDSINSEFPTLTAKYSEAVASEYGSSKYYSHNIYPNLNIARASRSKVLFDHPFYEDLKVEDVDGVKSLIHEPTGFNSSKIQAGFFTRPTLDVWPYNTDDYLKNAGARASVGVPLPIYGANHFKEMMSEMKNLGILNAETVVEIPYSPAEGRQETYKIDVSFLLQRGQNSEQFQNYMSLVKQAEKYKNLLDNKINDLKSFKTQYHNMVSEIQRDLENENIKIKRTDPRNSRALRNLNEKINKYKQTLEEVKYKYDNLDEYANEARISYREQIKQLQSEFKNIPYSVYTEKSSYLINPVSWGGMSEGSLSDLKAGEQTDNVSPPYLYFTDPVTAYKLIMQQTLHGSPYEDINSSATSKLNIKGALIDFIVNIYNLDAVAENFYEARAERLSSVGYKKEQFDGKTLLKLTAEGKIQAFGGIKIDYSDIMPGRRYDLSMNDSSIQLVVDKPATQYLNSPEVRKTGAIFPAAESLKTMLAAVEQSKTVSRGKRQSFRTYGLIKVTDRARKSMNAISYRAQDYLSKRILLAPQRVEEDVEYEEEEDLENEVIDRILKRI